MKHLITLLILSLATLSGCGTKKEKDQLLETQEAPITETLFEHREDPNDTTLPREVKARNGFLKQTEEPVHIETHE